MYSIKISEKLDKLFLKLKRKNPKHMNVINKKISEICIDPKRYKNLRTPLNKLKRVHVDKHFVLTFSVDKNKHIIYLHDFAHHNKIYKK